MLRVVVAPNITSTEIGPLPETSSKLILMSWVIRYISKVLKLETLEYNKERFVFVDTDVFTCSKLWKYDKTEFENIIFSMLLDANIHLSRSDETSIKDVLADVTKPSEDILPVFEPLFVPQINPVVPATVQNIWNSSQAYYCNKSNAWKFPSSADTLVEKVNEN